jgi:endonuclease/exonuclease/phosphatase family metal-dependent hydrolase
VIASEGDFGYYNHPEAHKVLLWSRTPWAHVDAVGTADMPGGRFIAGTTETLIGTLRVIGVCIPWQEAHVRSGNRNRQRWEDHLAYLRELAPILRSINPSVPSVVMGDFNQRLPRQHQPPEVYQALLDTLGPDFDVVTSGVIESAPEHSIDHVAISHHLRPRSVRFISNHDAAGKELSDHFGLQVILSLAL